MILSIDCGFSGALAWYDETSRNITSIMPMPIKDTSTSLLAPISGKSRPEIDAVALARAIQPFFGKLSCVVVEKVTASPNMGVTSAFRFGEGYGLVMGILAAYNFRVHHALPAVWKSSLGLGKDKSESAALAAKLFPEWADIFAADKKSADLAEAALLAYYGSRFTNQGQS